MVSSCAHRGLSSAIAKAVSMPGKSANRSSAYRRLLRHFAIAVIHGLQAIREGKRFAAAWPFSPSPFKRKLKYERHYFQHD